MGEHFLTECLPWWCSLFRLHLAAFYGVLCVGIFSNTASVTEKITLLETLAGRKSCRGFAAASPNIFRPSAKNSSYLILLLRAKQKTTRLGGFCFGGEGGIRTLEPLLMVTRFPIVRARPTTRLLHIGRRLLYTVLGEKSSIF